MRLVRKVIKGSSSSGMSIVFSSLINAGGKKSGGGFMEDDEEMADEKGELRVTSCATFANADEVDANWDDDVDGFESNTSSALSKRMVEFQLEDLCESAP